METRIQLEVSRVWAQKNPSLFVKSVFDFHKKTKDWKKAVDESRPGMVIFVAVKPDSNEAVLPAQV